MPGIDQEIAFISLSDVTTTAGSWELNSTNGNSIVGKTFTFNPNATLKTLIVNDDDANFSDDDLPGQSPDWGGDAVGQTVGAGSEVGTVGAAVEAEFMLTLSATVEGVQKNYEILVVQQGGNAIGYAFKGEIPPYGIEFTVSANEDSVQLPGGGYAPVGTPYVDIVTCFAGGTMIQTLSGERRIDDLQPGDKVLTKDNGYQEIRWIGSSFVSASHLGAHPKLAPIRISAGSLGGGTPSNDLLVSPEHRILVRSSLARKLFGADEVLIAAKHLLLIDGVDIATDMAAVEYFHMLFDRHEIVVSNGAETESLYTGPMALLSVSAEAKEEIFSLFPELNDPDHISPPARLLPSHRQSRKLVVRHNQHDAALVS